MSLFSSQIFSPLMSFDRQPVVIRSLQTTSATEQSTFNGGTIITVFEASHDVASWKLGKETNLSD